MRIATFNIENLNNQGADAALWPARKAVLIPALDRIDADILCLQEVHGQEEENKPRQLLALRKLLDASASYGNDKYSLCHTETTSGKVYNERNIVTVVRKPLKIESARSVRDSDIGKLTYAYMTSGDDPPVPKEIGWERPLLHAEISVPGGSTIHVINLHLKSRLPTEIPNQKAGYAWLSAAGWAEGYFVASMKRVGNAFGVRKLVDDIFEKDAKAQIVVAGDFNAELDEVPVLAIRGRVEETGNGDLAPMVLFPCETSIAPEARFSHLHHGQGNMLDHLLASRSMFAKYQGTEIHNELIHDESVAFAGDVKFPESDHGAVVATFRV